jgi:predicted nucleotidyltransferase
MIDDDEFGHFPSTAKILKVVQALNYAGVKYCIIGAIAANFYGQQRATDNIDILISESDEAKTESVLNDIGYVVDTSYPSDIGEKRYKGATYIDIYINCNGIELQDIVIKVWEYEGYQVPVVNRQSIIKLLDVWIEHHPDAEVLKVGHD